MKLGMLAPAIFLILNCCPASSQSISQKCDSVMLAQALTVELARDEAASLAALSRSPRVTQLLKQGAKKAGANAYYTGVAIGATAVCMTQNLPSVELPDVEDVRDYLFGPDDPCENEKESLRSAKKETRGTKGCLAQDSRATIEFKINRYERLLAARIAVALCIDDDEPNHAGQIRSVRAIVDRCKDRLPK